MKVTLSTIGRFHIFPLARELEKKGFLERVYSGFLWSRLAREGISRDRVRTFPWIRPLLMGARHLPFPLPPSLVEWLHASSVATLDRYVALTLPKSDIYVGHEAVGLISGAEAKKRGMIYICDRGCTHMAWRERILTEENARAGLPSRKRPSTYQREIDEYATADLIVVPSEIARRSFVEEGISERKVKVVPYGVNVDRFHQVGMPDAAYFDILFVGGLSVRKGALDILEAFKRIDIPNKRLTFAGSVTSEIKALLQAELKQPGIRFLGHVAHEQLKEFMSCSHVLLMPSIEDGFGMVVAEAMACGCPSIVSEHAGAADIVKDGENGFIVPIHDPESIAQRLETLAQNPDLRRTMSEACLKTIRNLNGWESYGEQMIEVYRQALEARERSNG